ncbi:hypothetical protein CLOLEP_03964 [[Clostridium] leptum DSM 753]|uniref:Uncharacterized protein n=1 Tax=[Clostridium] leptum DSM 753 TaxID=428125 RepID=A7VZD5_9FIRM|nr:hypothetical protein CLOLEP_03964 [[Clostridium] leptum DSM 753]
MQIYFFSLYHIIFLESNKKITAAVSFLRDSAAEACRYAI